MPRTASSATKTAKPGPKTGTRSTAKPGPKAGTKPAAQSKAAKTSSKATATRSTGKSAPAKNAASKAPSKVSSKTPSKATGARNASQKTTAKSATRKKTTAQKTPARSNAGRKPTATLSGKDLLRTLFVDGLKDIYGAEKQLAQALPKLVKAATADTLRTAFQDHLVVTQSQAQRLEQAFGLLNLPVRGKKCEAMDGLVKEAKAVIDETPSGTSTLDVGLIMAAQKVEHYEIASYGGLAQIARTLGEDQVAELLDGILSEEKETDILLTRIAENDVNFDAMDEGTDESNGERQNLLA